MPLRRGHQDIANSEILIEKWYVEFFLFQIPEREPGF